MDFDDVLSRVTGVSPADCPTGDRIPAAVAMILRRGGAGLEIFFIRRAHHPNDPWSGNIGFPGGRYEPYDASLRHTAERETMEEVGIDLSAACYLGRLSDIVGHNLPVRVSCFVFGLPDQVEPVLGHEVHTAFWVGLDRLVDPAAHLTARVCFGKQMMDVPAINLSVPDMPVLWGITYRLVSQFCHLIGCEEEPVIPYELPV